MAQCLNSICQLVNVHKQKLINEEGTVAVMINRSDDLLRTREVYLEKTNIYTDAAKPPL